MYIENNIAQWYSKHLGSKLNLQIALVGDTFSISSQLFALFRKEK